jgi:(p)ppGpp synthase/HD superfamily hydrolase
MSNSPKLKKLARNQKYQWEGVGFCHAFIIMAKSMKGPNRPYAFFYLSHIGTVVVEMQWALQHSSPPYDESGIQCALLHDSIKDTTGEVSH